MLRKASGPILALSALLGACGGTPSPSQPGSDPPAPTPAPTPTSAGLLHVLQDPYVSTYEIDAATGRLRLRAAQNTGDTQVLASDPRGRYVYAAHSRRTGPSCGGLSGVVIYAPNGHGMLEPVSEFTEEVGDGWVAFSASPTRLHSVRYSNWGTTCRHTTYYYESLAIGSDGQLGDETSGRRFPFDNEAGVFRVDPRSDMLYKAGRTAA